MRTHRRTLVVAALAALLLALPASLPAAEPEKISPASYIVKLDPSGPAVEVTFALALSEVSTYPVTITAIGGEGEEVLWTGSLADGVYRLRAPLTKVRAGAVKIVLRTKVINRTEGASESNIVYLKWEGSL